MDKTAPTSRNESQLKRYDKLCVSIAHSFRRNCHVDKFQSFVRKIKNKPEFQGLLPSLFVSRLAILEESDASWARIKSKISDDDPTLLVSHQLSQFNSLLFGSDQQSNSFRNKCKELMSINHLRKLTSLSEFEGFTG